MTGSSAPTNVTVGHFDETTTFTQLLTSDAFGCTDAVAAAIIANGITCVDDFNDLTEDDIDSIVMTIRKPAAKDQAKNVGFKTVKNLKAAVFGVTRSFRVHISVRSDPVALNDKQYDARLFNRTTRIKEWQQQKLQLEKRTDTDAILSVKDHISKGLWPKVFEALDNHIGAHYSTTTKVSLGYAIRLSADWQATTGNMADDLVDRLRTKQSGALYWNEDNGKLYQILVETFRGTICAPYIKMFAKVRLMYAP